MYFWQKKENFQQILNSRSEKVKSQSSKQYLAEFLTQSTLKSVNNKTQHRSKQLSQPDIKELKTCQNSNVEKTLFTESSHVKTDSNFYIPSLGENKNRMNKTALQKYYIIRVTRSNIFSYQVSEQKEQDKSMSAGKVNKRVIQPRKQNKSQKIKKSTWFNRRGSNFNTQPEEFRKNNFFNHSLNITIEDLRKYINMLRENRQIQDVQHQYRSDLQIKSILAVGQKAIHDTTEHLEKLKKSLGSKEIITQTINQLVNLSSFFKMPAFNIMTMFYCSRIQFYFRNYRASIQLLQSARTLLKSNFKFDRIKLKIFKHLAQCHLKLNKMAEVKMYTTKYLQMSWKLKDLNAELNSYEIFGLYHYYIGNMMKAVFFHQKMTNAEYEDDNSPIKRLALAKLKNREDKKMSDAKEENFQISSDEDSFEFIITGGSLVDTNQKEKKNVQRFQLRANVTNTIIKNQNFREDLLRQANSNIRTKKDSRVIEVTNTVDMQQIKFQKQVRDRILLSHLSPNRQLDIYQNVECPLRLNQSEGFQQLQSFKEKFEDKKIRSKFQKLEEFFQKVELEIRNLKQFVYN